MSNLAPWEPLGDMMTLREAMNRLFEESFLRPGALNTGADSGMNAPVDVYETEQNVVLKAAVPGIRPEDLDVSITGDVLTIKGEFKEERSRSSGATTSARNASTAALPGN